MNEELIKKSKYLSLLLRHKPEKAGITLDKEGWCSIEELCSKTDLTVGDLIEIVSYDEKQRYSMQSGKIRANQGHSLKVDLNLKKVIPPTILYHGTKMTPYDLHIKYEGLKKMNRSHVHLSEDVATARVVADRRKGVTTILIIEARKMALDGGHTFYKSENGVWLTDHVPAEYISERPVTPDYKGFMEHLYDAVEVGVPTDMAFLRRLSDMFNTPVPGTKEWVKEFGGK
jgi:putative RNA 2'-phosphotransferase